MIYMQYLENPEMIFALEDGDTVKTQGAILTLGFGD